MGLTDILYLFYLPSGYLLHMKKLSNNFIITKITAKIFPLFLLLKFNTFVKKLINLKQLSLTCLSSFKATIAYTNSPFLSILGLITGLTY